MVLFMSVSYRIWTWSLYILSKGVKLSNLMALDKTSRVHKNKYILALASSSSCPCTLRVSQAEDTAWVSLNM